MAIMYADGSNSSSGRVIQVVSGQKTSASSHATSGSFVDISLSATITPKETASKILIHWYVGKVGTSDWSGASRLMRDSTAIAIGDASGQRARIGTSFARPHDSNHWQSTSMLWYDDPSTTSAVTYKVQVQSHGSYTVYINRGEGNGNDTDVYAGRSASMITLMEIAQ